MLLPAVTALLLLHPALSARTPDAKGETVATRTITRDWTFSYRPDPAIDSAPAAIDFNDRAWPAVALPHTWSTFETTRELHPFIKAASERDDPYWWRGWGWYRKHLSISPQHRGRRVFLEFDGVQKHSRVYMNGVPVGEHKGGYTSFSVDVTDAVRFGSDNVIAVAVSNRRDDLAGGIPPMTAGNFNVYGGIYRDVRLVVKDALHFPFQGAADHEGGVWVTTPEVSAATGTVRVRSWIRNDHRTAQRATLATEIRDPNGAVVATLREERTIAPGAVAAFDQTTGPLSNPRLWSPQTPDLYRVTSSIVRNGAVLERIENPLGFRWFQWDRASNRLILNDKPIVIAGTNRHQDYPWLGDAIPKRLHERELREIRRDLGHNFIRAAHYPNDPLVYDMTDRLGLITVEEVPNIKSIDFGEEVQRDNVAEMIRRDRNHPSIMFWSVGNETDDPVDSCLAKRLDPDRLIHARKAENAGACVDHDHRDLDMETLLRVTVRGWETEDAVAGARGRPMQSPNGQTAGTEEWAHRQARVDGGSVRGRIDRQGVAWLYADHGADRRYENAPVDHVNAKGWVDLYRFPKTLYRLWQANWAERPVVFVHPWYWQRRYLGQRRSFQVDSNCDEVELLVNGRAIGRQRPSRAEFRTVTFPQVLVAAGRLEARCTGRADVVDRVDMAGPPAAVRLSVDQPSIVADRAGLGFVTADIVDAAGVPVQGASNTLTWSVDGPGTLVGPDTYASDKDKVLAEEGTGYVTTPVRNIVRATTTPGRIRIRVAAMGLAGGEAVLTAVAPLAPPADGIVETRLADAGRRPVARDPAYDPFRSAGTDAPAIARIENENVSFPPSSDAELRASIDAFVRKRNPALPVDTPAYSALLDRLRGAVKRTNRQLIPDDFNFVGDTFNDASRLADILADLGLPARYRAQIDAYYADLLVERGRTIDLPGLRSAYASAAKGGRIFAASPDGPAQPVYDSPFDVWRIRATTLDVLLAGAMPGGTGGIAERIRVLNPHSLRGATNELAPGALVLVPAALDR
jgi:hypothetical protein